MQSKIPWRSGPSLMQYFSLPDSIIYYSAMNPSTPKCYNKLIQCCKYFFEKNPILVAPRMYNSHPFSMQIFYPILIRLIGFPRADPRKFYINEIISKIWIFKRLCIQSECNFRHFYTYELLSSSLICAKLFRGNEIDDFQLWKTKITFDNFKFLSSSATYLRIYHTKITYNDGENIVMFDSIFESIPESVKKFEYAFGFRHSVSRLEFPEITSSTFKNMSKIIHRLPNLEFVRLRCIPEIINVEDVLNFITVHKNIKMSLHFYGRFSDGYKIQLDGLIDKIIESQISECLIEYKGQDEEKLEIMKNRGPEIVAFINDD